MLQGELNTRGNLRGELTGGIFYGTMDYDELINKPSINSVELSGNKSLEDLGIIIPTNTSDLNNDSGFITSADVPTSTSQLTNDSGFITTSDLAPVAVSGSYNDLTNKPTIPTLTSQLTNDSGFITTASVPTSVSQLANDMGYITASDIPTDVSAFTNDAGYITASDIPTDVSAFTNDAGYITAADIPTDVSAFTNDAGYISASDLIPATASGSIATFTDGGDDIPVSEYECDIVAQQASGTPTPASPLPITGFSQADITVTDNDQITNLYTVAFGQTIYGDRLIYKDGEWSIEATHKILTFSGSEIWNYHSSGFFYTNTTISNYISNYNGITTNGIRIRNATVSSQLSLRVYVSDNTDYIDSSTDMNTILTNGIQYLYPLATPIIIPITSSTRVKTISGVNNIFSNTGDNSVKYFTENADSLAELIKAFVL